MNVVNTDSKTKEKMQYWRNPENNVVYELYHAPGVDYKFSEGQPIMDLNIKQNNVRLAKDGHEDKRKDIYLDSHFAGIVDKYVSDIRQGGQVRQAALHSSTNAAVDILNVFGEVFGKLDRKYAGKNLAREIPVPNLLIDIDSVNKFTGLTRIGELSLPSAADAALG